jgi:hypothetical protein
MKPDVWMIQIPDNPTSMYYRGRVEASWEGYNVKYFNAITPETMDKLGYLHFGKKRDTIEFTPTEKAVWYSHVELWAKARKKPIIIIEHDAMLVLPIPDNLLWEKHDMVCLGHTGKNKKALPGLAYYLKPAVATRMVKDAKSIDNITWNSDGTIHGYCGKNGVFVTKHVSQIQNRSIGTTIEHKKK